MLQIFTMMFFSIAALGGMLILSEMLIGSWPEVKHALAPEPVVALPCPAPARVRVRWTPQAVARPTLRAAA